jgi:hypothetical protein
MRGVKSVKRTKVFRPGTCVLIVWPGIPDNLSTVGLMTVKHTATKPHCASQCRSNAIILTPLSVLRLSITQQDGGQSTKKLATEEEVQLPAAFGYTVRSLDADE